MGLYGCMTILVVVSYGMALTMYVLSCLTSFLSHFTQFYVQCCGSWCCVFIYISSCRLHFLHLLHLFCVWHLVLLVHMCLQLKFGFLFASHYLHLFSVVAGGVVFSYVSLVDLWTFFYSGLGFLVQVVVCCINLGQLTWMFCLWL